MNPIRGFGACTDISKDDKWVSKYYLSKDDKWVSKNYLSKDDKFG